MFSYYKISIFLILITITQLLNCQSSNEIKSPYLILYAFDTEGELLTQKMKLDSTKQILGRTVYIGKLSGNDIILAESGIGMTNAAMTTQKLIDIYTPQAVFFTGIAGAIDTAIKIGDIVICDRWITHDYGYIGANGFQSEPIKFRKYLSDSSYKDSFFVVNKSLLEKAVKLQEIDFSLEKIADRSPKLVVSGIGVSGNTFIDNYEKRLQLYDQFKALIVDMETASVAQVCTINDIPFIAFRSASDLAGGSGSSTASVELERFFEVAAFNSSQILIKYLEEF